MTSANLYGAFTVDHAPLPHQIAPVTVEQYLTLKGNTWWLQKAVLSRGKGRRWQEADFHSRATCRRIRKALSMSKLGKLLNLLFLICTTVKNNICLIITVGGWQMFIDKSVLEESPGGSQM